MLRLAALSLAFCLSGLASVVASESLHPELEHFRPLIGTTWKGEMAQSTSETPIFDVVHYERILNGQAIRATHSINDGAYGGITIIRWDESRQSLVYDYFTTAGFTTEGTMSLQEGKFVALEKTSGNAGGVTEVRSEGSFSTDKIVVASEYLTEGKWEPGHAATYFPAPDSTVRFK